MNRSDEDWSALCDRALLTDAWDPLKYISLGHGGSFLTLGGEWRPTYERYGNYNWGAGPQDNDGYYLNRLMAHVDAHLTEHVRGFVELQSGLESGRSGGSRPVIDRDKLDVNQLFLELNSSSPSANAGISIRLGRQELDYGEATLVSIRDLNVRRAFDGVKVRASSDRWRIDGFLVKPVGTHDGILDDSADDDQTLWGAWAVRTKGLPSTLSQVDVYYLGLARENAPFAQGTSQERRHSFGFNLHERVHGFSFAQEGDLQVGTFGSGQLLAWKLAQETSYSFPRSRLRPSVSFLGAVSSGDKDSASPDLQTFHPLFPKGVYYGHMVFTSGSLNAIVAHPSTSLQLSRTVSLVADAFFLWRQRLSDGLYSQSGAMLRTGQGSSARYIGAATDLGIAWQVDAHTTIQFVAASYSVGSYLRDTLPTGRDARYVTVVGSYKF